MAEPVVAGLDSIGTRDLKQEAFDREPEEQHRPLGPQFVENLLRALQRFNRGTLCDAAAEKISLRREVFSPVTLVVPAIERIWVSERRDLQAFARNPTEPVHRFRVRKKRRGPPPQHERQTPARYEARDRARGFASDAGPYERPPNLRPAPSNTTMRSPPWYAPQTGAPIWRATLFQEDGGCREAGRWLKVGRWPASK